MPAARARGHCTLTPRVRRRKAPGTVANKAVASSGSGAARRIMSAAVEEFLELVEMESSQARAIRPSCGSRVARRVGGRGPATAWRARLC